MSKKNSNNKEEIKWFITVFITTFILSIVFSCISTNAITHLSLIPAILFLVITVFIGIVFDIIAVAVTVAEEEELHAKASKKIEGAKASIKLVRNSSKVANICADVIGDICGVLSGSIAALITISIMQKFKLQFNIRICR